MNSASASLYVSLWKLRSEMHQCLRQLHECREITRISSTSNWAFGPAHLASLCAGCSKQPSPTPLPFCITPTAKRLPRHRACIAVGRARLAVLPGPRITPPIATDRLGSAGPIHRDRYVIFIAGATATAATAVATAVVTCQPRGRRWGRHIDQVTVSWTSPALTRVCGLANRHDGFQARLCFELNLRVQSIVMINVRKQPCTVVALIYCEQPHRSRRVNAAAGAEPSCKSIGMRVTMAWLACSRKPCSTQSIQTGSKPGTDAANIYRTTWKNEGPALVIITHQYRGVACTSQGPCLPCCQDLQQLGLTPIIRVPCIDQQLVLECIGHR